ncbi:putative glycosyltransferase [Senna tora]|uniref:Putative glycosyltransferase n=1 Tax=Senna tora TaxID=362788 RepID=A0A834W4I1_9FABA|nr:putative glycosyltransferase [Senna tora]
MCTLHSYRTTLGFWAGHRNSKIRVILARVWENDTELDISNNRINRASGHLVYQKRFYRSKFCICPGGSQVNSARIADSIHYGCIPVILSNYYDLPFNDILDWRKFSVILKETDVYQLKQILKNISEAEFVALHKNLVKLEVTSGVTTGSETLSMEFASNQIRRIPYDLTIHHTVHNPRHCMASKSLITALFVVFTILSSMMSVNLAARLLLQTRPPNLPAIPTNLPKPAG